MAWKKNVLWTAILVSVLTLSWLCWVNREQIDPLRAFLAGIPPVISVLFFITAYVLSSFILVDIKDLFKIVAALAFGAWASFLYIFIAELLNNVLFFHLARRLGRSWLEKHFHLSIKDIGWVNGLCGGVQIFILRLLPVVPFRVLDMAYGLTAVQFRKYFMISVLASPVRIFWLQFILAGLGMAAMDPRKLTPFLQEHPVFLQLSLVYLAASGFAAFVLTRRKKDVVTSKE